MFQLKKMILVSFLLSFCGIFPTEAQTEKGTEGKKNKSSAPSAEKISEPKDEKSVRKRKEAELLKISFELRKGETKSVVRGASSGGSRRQDRWGRLAVDYLSYPEWSDEIQFLFYALLYQKPEKMEKQKQKNLKSVKDLYTLLKGEVTYLNVPQGKANRAVMFIHPNTLARYGEVKELRVEVRLKGEKQDDISESFSSGKEKKRISLKEWWTKFTPTDGHLLNRMSTPFIFDSDNSTHPLKKS